MTKLSEIVAYFEEAVPNAMKMDFDNVGFLVGDSAREISKTLVALDITDEVIDEAIGRGAELIVSHHPLFFQLRTVTDQTPAGRKIISCFLHAVRPSVCTPAWTV
jgi:putative NIF3 family GTP cyclohydrolase 1 type 2